MDISHIKHFLKSNVVLLIAIAAAVATSFFIPPSKAYLNYPDYKTLACLFITLAVICALKDIEFFSIMAGKIVMLTGNLRVLAIALVYITFIGSMLIANDMALITFLPLGYFSLKVTKNESKMAYVFILQNISANLGGMLTPFGNPQNLYLYSAYNIPTLEFLDIMYPPFILAVLMLTAACFLLKPTPLSVTGEEHEPLDTRKTALYIVLFLFSILVVFRMVPYWMGLVLVPAVLVVSDRKALLEVDYGLLFTFLMFFIFAGNLSKIPVINEFLSGMLAKNPLLVSIFSCQFISNVPSAILLSRFTGSYRALLMGVNIGGTGTLIASLASLITFSQFRKYNPGKGKYYFLLFTLVNVIFLVVMTAFASLIL